MLLVDASVLIDFATTDPTVLSLAVRHLGALHVPREVLDEVNQLDDAACGELGIIVVDGSLEQITEAAAVRGRLSFEDRLCMILARDYRWTCITNDGALRCACEAEGVLVMWGLQLIRSLVVAQAIAPAAAVTIAEAIGRTNPRMAPAVVDEFRRQIAGLFPGRP